MSQRNGVPITSATTSLKNIVVFGESGVGKSSLVNLIAGRSVAATSGDAMGCTSHHKKYEVQVDDTPYAIWDTAGFHEGTYGTVPAMVAEKYLKRLLHDLPEASGIHLLMYCIRASRLRKASLDNYNLFYSEICRKKVPIVVVVTELEKYKGEMEDWWTANGREFATLRMHFDGHACVTTLGADKVNSSILGRRRDASGQAVLSLIANTCARDPQGNGNEHSHHNNGFQGVHGLPTPNDTGERDGMVPEVQRTTQTCSSTEPTDVAPTGCFRWLFGGRRSAKSSKEATSAPKRTR